MVAQRQLIETGGFDMLDRQIVQKSTTLSESALEMQQLGQIYLLINPIEIEEYISFNKPLMNVLINIPEKIKNYLNKIPSEIRNYFSTEKLSLELHIDPEISGYKTLTVYLPTDINVDVEMVFDALIEIKEQWIADVSSTILSKISISLRFQQI